MAATKVLRGVNLTGWLTLEPWVTPEPFARTATVDEVSLAAKLGKDEYAELVRAHRASFIHSEDFSRIAARGFNALRLPIPWYVFEPQNTPYQPCIDMVDKALEWAEEIGLHVIFVLAVNPGLPGGQDSTPGGSPVLVFLARRALKLSKSLRNAMHTVWGFLVLKLPMRCNRASVRACALLTGCRLTLCATIIAAHTTSFVRLREKIRW